jgi:hypothetical protein
MSNLLKALKRAEQDRRQKLQEDETPLSSESVLNETAEQAVGGRQNPLLDESAPIEKQASADAAHSISPTALVVLLALAIMVAGNFGYWVRGRSATPESNAAIKVTAADAAGKRYTSGVPHALLSGEPVPLQLRLDRRTEVFGNAIAR